jgi:hypothetical protein
MRTTEHVSASPDEPGAFAQKVRIGHRVATLRNSGASTLQFWREMTDTSDMDRNGRKGHEMEISVAIGRNVGNEPMSDIDWLDFRSETVETAERYGWVVNVRELGESRYAYTREESYRFWAKNNNYHASDILDLRRDLSDLARKYGQWGIALTYATTEIIGASSDTPNFIEEKS